MTKRTSWGSIAAAAIVLSALLSAANLFLGDLNQDEGWYLYAARQVAEGRVLYRDFMFTQGPALPTVYGLLFPIIGKFGVAGGRLITALFGLAAAGCAAWLAGSAVSRVTRLREQAAGRHWKPVALAAFILAGVNVYQSYFTTIVKTYSLCAFFLTAGFVALSYSNSRRGATAAFLGGFLLALAACTRLSAGAVLPVAGIWLICNRKKVFPLSWLAFGLGGGLVLLVGLGIFFVLAPENTEFALFGYHAGRSPGGLMELAALKAGFASRFVQAYFVFAAGCVLAFFFRTHLSHVNNRALEKMGPNARPRLTELIQQANQEASPFSHSFVSLLWLCGLAVTLVHFAAPFPYDDYQVIVYPLLSAALAATLVPRCPEKYMFRSVFALLLVCTAASFSSPINQDWMIRGRDRIWWKFKAEPDLAMLQKTGRQIREMLGPDGLLLTQDTYLAVEAGARVPHGMEMGPFCYYPQMPPERAEKLNLLNEEMMLDILKQARAPVAAFSGYGLSIVSPQISKISSNDWKKLRSALDASYIKTAEVPDFGQAHTVLEVFRRR
jgi:hypothetical protein